MLVVTIHDVAPPTLPAVIALRELAGAWGVTRATLLAVPNFHGTAPLADHAPTADWLRRRTDAGDEVALHGRVHLQTAPIRGPGMAPAMAIAIDALRARAFTSGEAEMLGAGAADPIALAAARDELAALVRAPVRGFVAPAWLEPRGLGDMLADIGFDWHETGLAIERLRDRRSLVSPVIGFATRTALRRSAALAWAALLGPVLQGLAALGRPARIALHPGDLAAPSVLAAAQRSIRRLLHCCAAVTTAAALDITPRRTR